MTLRGSEGGGGACRLSAPLAQASILSQGDSQVVSEGKAFILGHLGHCWCSLARPFRGSVCSQMSLVL